MQLHRILFAVLLVACLTPARGGDVTAARPTHHSAHLRRPVAVGLLDEGRMLALANQRSGSVSLIDLKASKVVCEEHVGAQLSGLAVQIGRASCRERV